MPEEGVDPSLPAAERGLPHSRISANEAFYYATAGGGRELEPPDWALARKLCVGRPSNRRQHTDRQTTLFDDGISKEDLLHKD